ncbi:hypothetical protein O77CONTIG1_01272 [Leptolyngbya sp. O-77]|nr:hypothetical protein O77CONTIG1_01272 [Leptolyngbya sp. O-77]
MMDQVREWVHNQGCSMISTPNFLRPLLKGTTHHSVSKCCIELFSTSIHIFQGSSNLVTLSNAQPYRALFSRGLS